MIKTGCICLVVLSFIGCGSQDQKKTTTEKDSTVSQNVATPAPPQTKAEIEASIGLNSPAWAYDSSDDKMHGAKHWANIYSTNEVKFKFPYDGGSHGKIMVRKEAGARADAIFSIDKGQFASSDGSKIFVKFDDSKPQTFGCSESASGQSNLLFVDNSKKFIEQIKKAHHVIVEATFYQEGSRQLEFDVSGLKWND